MCLAMDAEAGVAVFEHLAAQPEFQAQTCHFMLSETGRLALSPIGVAEMQGREIDRDIFTLELEDLTEIKDRIFTAAIGFYAGKAAFDGRGGGMSSGEMLLREALGEGLGEQISNVRPGDKDIKDNEAGLISINFKVSVAHAETARGRLAELDRGPAVTIEDETVKFFLDVNVACKRLGIKKQAGGGEAKEQTIELKKQVEAQTEAQKKAAEQTAKAMTECGGKISALTLATDKALQEAATREKAVEDKLRKEIEVEAHLRRELSGCWWRSCADGGCGR